MPETRRRRNRRGEGERLRRDVLDATTGLLAEAGDANAVSMREVAAAAHVTPPAIYRLFTDKEELLRTVIAERFADFDRILDAAAADASTPAEGLERRCRAYLDYSATHPGHYRVLFSASHLGPVEVGATEGGHPGAASFGRLLDAVTACLGADEEAGARSFAAAVTLWSFLHGLADLRITKPEFPWPPADDLVPDLLDRLLPRS
ncbi:MAG: TetR/AcrR family transcriptional regulator [Iamia sp.]